MVPTPGIVRRASNAVRSRIDGARRALRDDGTLTSVLKNSGWLTGSSGLLIVLFAIQGIMTARILGVAVWGTLAVAVSFSAITGRLLSFRMNEFVVKWVTHLGQEEAAKAATAFKLALAADVGSALVAFAIVELLAGWGAAVFAKNPDFAWLFRFMALTIVAQAGRESLIGILYVNRDFRAQSLVQVGCQTASVCGIAAVYLLGGGIRGVVVVLVGTEALAAALMWTIGLRAARIVLSGGWMRKKLVRLGRIGREMARFAILGNLSGTLSSMMNDGDLLILGFLRNPIEVGYYKLAKAICQIAYLPEMPLVNASYPEFSAAAATRSWDSFRLLMRRGSKVAALWLLPVSIGLVVLARPAIAMLYGPAFLPAAPALAILLVGFNVDGILFWTRATLLSMGEPGFPTAVNLWTTVAKFALAFIFVPAGGYLALAAVNSVALVGMNALTARRTIKRLRMREMLADE
jgi:O-antigen/teichoic acid export membrane protein